jgi:hypothetical protein
MQFRPNCILNTSSTGIIAFLTLSFTTAASAGEACPEHLPGILSGVVQPLEITESSGLAASRESPGILWTHNDNWGDQRVFALGQDGLLRATWTLSVTPVVANSEDIDIGPGPVAGVNYLYFGDIGDNNNIRTSIRVLRAVEPFVPVDEISTGGPLPAQIITLVYPDGPRDSEAMMVDTNGDIYLIAKRVTPGRIYRAPYPQSTTQTNVLQAVGQLAGWGESQTTSADISPDGSSIVVRGYGRITMWTRLPGQTIAETLAQTPCEEPQMWEPQGEAICFRSDGNGYFTTSEGLVQPIYFFPPVIECLGDGSCDDGDPCTNDYCQDFLCVNEPNTNDEDGDLVLDCVDLCLGTPAGRPIDVNGCSIFGAISVGELVTTIVAANPDAEAVARLDRNFDGVLDAVDLPILINEILGQ